MKTSFKIPPRKFEVAGHTLRDHGSVSLDAGDLVSVRAPGGGDCDVTATAWGLYLGPSLNGRLKDNGYRAALVRNPQGKLFLQAVCAGREDAFKAYLDEQGLEVLAWLDGDVNALREALGATKS